jgi:hypothetical protein
MVNHPWFVYQTLDVQPRGLSPQIIGEFCRTHRMTLWRRWNSPLGGLEPVGDARMKFDILYYVIGILYLIFDLEIIFLFPLATVLFSLGSLLALWVVLIFLIILTIGFLYEWFHGALEIVLNKV